MTTHNFAVCIERVLKHEAGYVNDPADPGGETKWGISKRSYPHINIKELSRVEAIGIYYRDFWTKMRGDTLPEGVAYQLLDSAVNSGMTQTVRFLQRAVGAADDGVFGPYSQIALAKATESDFIMLFVAERLEFMTRLRNWSDHGKGWVRRIAQNLRYGAQDS